MDVSSVATVLSSLSSLLWSLAGIVGAAIVLWFLWQILQIGRNLKEYGIDYTGYLRGEVYAAAKQEDIDIRRPVPRHTRGKFKNILENKSEKKT